MKIDDFRTKRRTGERKLQGESNLGDMSEVRVQEFEQGSAIDR